MNRSTLESRTSARHPLKELQAHEREARRLRAEHSRDPLASLVIAVDLHVRRAAHLIAAFLQALDRVPPSAIR